MQKGNISVQTENIFPIIKKFLYSDHEIFLRELIANATDATMKLKTLARRGEVDFDITDTRIRILIDKEAKTLTISDRGIGMNAEEVMKYLNQVAFSSAREFVEKYQDDASVIGHFGLGFYSSFMVSDKVDVITKSYRTDSTAVNGLARENQYTLEDVDKTTYGTDVVLHISEDSAEFLEDHRISSLLNKYCSFLPIEIEFGTKTEYIEDENADAEEGSEDEKKEPKSIEVPNVINNPSPAWKNRQAN